MKCRLMVAIVAFVSSIPALGWTQAPCACSPRSGSVIRPASHELWADYEMGGTTHGGDCCGGIRCGGCCDSCCPPLICIVPNTIRRVGRALDCLLPCGPRSGHGCGLSCIGAGSGCSCLPCERSYAPGIHVSGCASCGMEMRSNPFQDDPTPMSPPKPMPQETRRQNPLWKSSQLPQRQVASSIEVANEAPAAPPARKTAKVAARPSKSVGTDVSRAEHVAPAQSKQVSVLRRASVEADEETDEPVQPVRRAPKALLDFQIPRNPLR